MAGLVPAIHAVVFVTMKKRPLPSSSFAKAMQCRRVDTRDKRGHDAVGSLQRDAPVLRDATLRVAPQDEGF
jgi:hypothetical protein